MFSKEKYLFILVYFIAVVICAPRCHGHCPATPLSTALLVQLYYQKVKKSGKSHFHNKDMD